MPVIVAPQNPTIGSPEGCIVTYRGDGDFSIVRLRDVPQVVALKGVEKALRKLLVKLTELGISFSLRRISVEQDAEVESWRYALAEVELNLPGELFPAVEELLIQQAYSSLDAREATNLLLVLDHV